MAQKITCIGYGEAARAFSEGWRRVCGAEIAAFDIKTDDPATRDGLLDRYKSDGAKGCQTVAEAVAAGEIIVSLVTADRALEAARRVAELPLEGRLYCDGNSCAPQTKVEAQAVIEAAGGRYVDMAVMMPVHPTGHKTPVLISGADNAEDALRALDMEVSRAEGPVGTASGIKLCRSIVVKGIEALCAEMLLTSRHLGVEDPVLQSLDATYPGFDWGKRSSYAFDRMMIHGARRAAEMDETAKMVAATGLPSVMAAATVEWQAKIAALGLEPGPDDGAARADAVLARLLPG